MKGTCTWGRTFQRGAVWWIAYYVNGQEIRESAKSDDEADAIRLLTKRRKQIDGNCYVGRRGERLTVDELLDALVTYLENKGAKTVTRLKSHLKPLRAYFTLTRAVRVDGIAIQQYIKTRLDAELARATVNRELQALKQAYRLACRQRLLAVAPYIGLLTEDNVRKGFFEHADFLNVVKHLPDPVNDMAWFGYLSGWRKGEIVSLRWDAVDRTAREVRLATSKNGDPRVLPLDGDLWKLSERRWAARQVKMDDGTTKVSEFVFHRRGEAVAGFRKAWAACREAKVPGRLFHDLRRTAVRNMVRAGVPQSVAMSISGHKTVSMFLRYNITSTKDQLEALKKTAAHLAKQPKKRANVVELAAGRTEKAS